MENQETTYIRSTTMKKQIGKLVRFFQKFFWELNQVKEFLMGVGKSHKGGKASKSSTRVQTGKYGKFENVGQDVESMLRDPEIPKDVKMNRLKSRVQSYYKKSCKSSTGVEYSEQTTEVKDFFRFSGIDSMNNNLKLIGLEEFVKSRKVS